MKRKVAIMSVARLLVRLRAHRRERDRVRETVAQLSRLTDRELEDIGIARYEIAVRARA